jgi:hypothetical protein
MSRLLGLRVITALLGAVLTAGLVAAPAQANPRGPDPEQVHPALAPGRTTSPSIAAAPATVDSDVYAYVITPRSSTYFVVAGHLKLQLRSGSTTAYTGSLVDYVGNKSYKASVDATDAGAPTLKLEGKNGKFRVTLSSSFGSTSYYGTAVSFPSKLRVPTGKVFFVASAHSTRSASYAITLTERSGPIGNPFEYVGTLTVVYDANGRISGGQVTVTNGKGKNVTHGLSASGYYSSSYFYTIAKVDQTSMGLSATFSGTDFSGFAFAGSGSRTSQWVLTGTA